jgi:hypothetical protein
MRRHGVLHGAEPLRDLAGRQALRACLDQQPEDVEPGFLAERGKGGEGVFLSIYPNISNL